MSEMKVDLTNVSDSELLNECRKRFIVIFDVGYDTIDGFREDEDEEEYDEEADKKLYEEFKQYCDDDYRIQTELDRTYDDLMILMKEKWNDFERTKEKEEEEDQEEEEEVVVEEMSEMKAVPFENTEWYEADIDILKADWYDEYEGKNVKSDVESCKKLFIDRWNDDLFKTVDIGLFEEEVSREQVIMFMKKEWKKNDCCYFEDDHYLNLEIKDLLKYLGRIMVSHFVDNYIDEETGEYKC